MSNITYRRGQAEWALWRLFTMGRGPLPEDPPHAFKARIKKLLDLDREQAGASIATPGRAFGDTKAKTQARDAAFEAFDVFCLALALDLVDAGYLQAEAVAVLRCSRLELRKEFHRISKLHPPPSRARSLSKDYPKLPNYVDGAAEIADAQVFLILSKRTVAEALPSLRGAPHSVVLAPRLVRGRTALMRAMSLSFSKRSELVLEIAGAAKLIEGFLIRAPLITRARKT
ncbi:MAG TPA: hypothetical protein PLS69_06715 [Terricaulis sp.]|nr:hypothetical protein [Terricaulis sp.]